MLTGTHHFLAIDLGAGSGRAILGTLKEHKILLEEIHRFPNDTVSSDGHLYWNTDKLFEEMLTSLKILVSKNIKIESIGIDTWGVDFALLDKDGKLLSQPHAYRDQMTNGAPEEFYNLISKEKVYQLTGIQTMQFNSLFQLYALKKTKPQLISNAAALLFIPDIFNYYFTGIKCSEFSFVSTSQLLNPVNHSWATELFITLGIEPSIMQKILLPGTVIGNIKPEITQTTGMKSIPVIAVASHDTGSAVAAVPADGDNWAYLSSGTWSLMGIESDKPILTDEAMKCNFTNEGGVDGTTRFLKNITGLWLLQESKRIWDKEKEYSYSELVKMAEEAKGFQSFIDPDAPDFFAPDDMTEAIQTYCKKTNQTVPCTVGEIARVIFESLALKYRFVMETIEQLTQKKINKLHIIGGGSQNELLCQFAANATGAEVIAGPVEATAIGNIVMQAKTLGHFKSLKEMRQVIGESFSVKSFNPEDQIQWEKAYQMFSNIINEMK